MPRVEVRQGATSLFFPGWSPLVDTTKILFAWAEYGESFKICPLPMSCLYAKEPSNIVANPLLHA
jgi:hypothetical protein